MAVHNWARLPSKWIEEGGLRDLRWVASKPTGSDNAAALMVLATEVADRFGSMIFRGRLVVQAISEPFTRHQSSGVSAFRCCMDGGALNRLTDGRG
jgi:hypothetical protein